MTLANCTLSGNTVTGSGGMSAVACGTAARPRWPTAPSAATPPRRWGGLQVGNGGTMTLGNTSSRETRSSTGLRPRPASGVFVSSGNNLIGRTPAATPPGTSSDLTGTSANPLAPRDRGRWATTAARPRPCPCSPAAPPSTRAATPSSRAASPPTSAAIRASSTAPWTSVPSSRVGSLLPSLREAVSPQTPTPPSPPRWSRRSPPTTRASPWRGAW